MVTLYQYSHFMAVSKGCYDGSLSLNELQKHGNTGLGTLNGLDGELVVIDDVFYHCQHGKVSIAKNEALFSWAAIVLFQPEFEVELCDISSLEKLHAALIQHIKLTNYPIVFRMKAHVKNIALGSVPKQEKPYKPIAEIIQDSTLIDTGEIIADIVGFYAPEFMYPIKSGGLHLHFVDEGRQVGGHILDIDMIAANIYWQKVNQFQLVFPEHTDYDNIDLQQSDSQNLPKFEDRLKRQNN
jgi:acetolactate decarboxylase